MKIEHAIRKRGEERRVQPAHEAGEQHEVDAASAQRLDPHRLVGEAGAESPGGERERFDAERACAFQRRCLRNVGDEDRDRRAELVASRGARERFEIGSPAGSEDGDGARGGEHAAI